MDTSSDRETNPEGLVKYIDEHCDTIEIVDIVVLLLNKLQRRGMTPTDVIGHWAVRKLEPE